MDNLNRVVSTMIAEMNARTPLSQRPAYLAIHSIGDLMRVWIVPKEYRPSRTQAKFHLHHDLDSHAVQ